MAKKVEREFWEHFCVNTDLQILQVYSLFKGVCIDTQLYRYWPIYPSMQLRAISESEVQYR